MKAMNQSARAYARLRGEIIGGELAPGAHLHEVQVAERLSVSRTPLRQALQRLDREGLVKVVPGRGAFVSELSLSDVRHLFQLREALETHAARLCARSARCREFRSLQEEFGHQYTVLADGAGATRLDDYYELTERLDRQIDEVVANPYLTAAMEPIRDQLRRLRRIARRSPERVLLSATEHATVCRAIADGDEDAAAAATALHIGNSLRHILEAGA
ncbi:GntR family transcriptional regulator [Streptomyces sp. CS147]|uniref:GntR family transcriptional regulator n=1 Tax=Streptomyces sp. CS147 TaxID=2162715 RepID=UPI001EF555DE|nr:GntR family transcriptional regulator [Streptomyces sp. CS147]